MKNVINQRIYLRDGETVASPKVSTEDLFTTLMNNAYEG